MRLGLLSLPLAASLLALLACAGLAGAARNLAQTDGVAGEVAGTAVVVSVDMQDGTHASFLTVHRPDGRRVVAVTDAEQLHSVRSGQRVRVGGRWMKHPGRSPADEDGPAEPVNDGGWGCRGAKRCMRAATISRIEDTTTPVWQQETSDADGLDSAIAAELSPEGTTTFDAPDDSTGGAVRKLMQTTPPLVANPSIVGSSIKALFIPIAAVINPNLATSSKCAAVQAPLLTRAQIQAKVHPELAGGAASVGGTFNRCSYQKTRMTTATSNVTEIVRLPCASSDNTWTFATCDFDDFNGWADAANARLRAQGVPVDTYRYKVYLIPAGLCGWAGLAYTGCDGSFECRAWIEGGSWGIPMVMVHELGHNFFQDHSSFGTDEYGDQTCAMGSCCHDRCYNTPRAWHLGWVSLRQANKTHLPALGSSVTVSMYSQSVTSSPAGVRIDPTGWVASALPLFVGYRTANNMDVSLSGLGLSNEVHIYQSSISKTSGPVGTTLLASLAVGQSYLASAAGVRITRVAYTGTNTIPTAVVTITRTK